MQPFRDAIDVYSRGIARHPGEPRLYRHRGHRYITVRDFDRAIDLLKSIPLPEDRQRATVYMEGFAEMRRDWQKNKRRRR